MTTNIIVPNGATLPPICAITGRTDVPLALIEWVYTRSGRPIRQLKYYISVAEFEKRTAGRKKAHGQYQFLLCSMVIFCFAFVAIATRPEAPLSLLAWTLPIFGAIVVVGFRYLRALNETRLIRASEIGGHRIKLSGVPEVFGTLYPIASFKDEITFSD